MQNDGEDEPRHEGKTLLGHKRSTVCFPLGFRSNDSLFRCVKRVLHVMEVNLCVLHGLTHLFALGFRIQERIGCRDAASDAYEVSDFCLVFVNVEDILLQKWEYCTVQRMLGYVCCLFAFRMIVLFISVMCM